MSDLRRPDGSRRPRLNVRIDLEQMFYIMDRATELEESFSRMTREILQLGIKSDKRRKRRKEREIG